MNRNGKVIWRGPSLIDGQRIVIIATGYDSPSANSKTGPMIQTWIMLEGYNPQFAALHGGLDTANCGNCPYRMNPLTEERPCYVELWQAPRPVYAALRAGAYAECTDEDDIEAAGEGHIVRVGSYGDGAAAPAWVWRAFLRRARGWTGYSHQWNHRSDRVRDNALALQPFLMASVGSPDEYQQATAAGWRTFRVRSGAERGQLLAGEKNCPASKEAGHLTDCYHCQACSGLDGRGHSSIAIDVH